MRVDSTETLGEEPLRVRIPLSVLPVNDRAPVDPCTPWKPCGPVGPCTP